MEEKELCLFQIISASGNARSLCHEALQLYKNSKCNEGDAKYEEARKELVNAKKVHTQLLALYSSGELSSIDLLLIHAEDHMSSSQVVFEIVNELLIMYKKMDGK
jgi:PTS system cellobiose-specific IIA component